MFLPKRSGQCEITTNKVHRLQCDANKLVDDADVDGQMRLQASIESVGEEAQTFKPDFLLQLISKWSQS